MKSLFAFFCLYLINVLPSSAQIQQGEASYYKDFFEGRKTASGELFQQALPTAAHRTLALGTIVIITNKSNGKKTKVRINDRGPYIRNRIIDVSKSVAERLGFINDGTSLVKIEVINFADAESFYLEMDKLNTVEVANQETEKDDVNYSTETAVAEVENKQKDNNNYITPNTTQTETAQKVDVEATQVEVETSNISETDTKETIVQEKNTNQVEAVSTEEKSASNEEEFKSKKTLAKQQDKDKVNSEVVDLVRQVTEPEQDKVNTKVGEEKTKVDASEKDSNLGEQKSAPIIENNKASEKELPIDDVVQQLFSQVQKQPKVEQFFDINANRVKPDYLAIQVVSLSDAANAIDLGRKLEDFYDEQITLGYKQMSNNALFTLAIGNEQTREEAEELLEKIKERYPYAFILDTKK